MQGRLRRLPALLTAAFVVAGLLGLPVPANGQSLGVSSSWSDPIQVFGDEGAVSNPRIVADSEGTVHLLFQHVDPQVQASGAATAGALMYARLRQGRWSRPVEVLATPGGGAAVQPSLALDDQGYLHAIWRGEQQGSYVFYSRAPASLADSSNSWLPPAIVSEGMVSPGNFGASADVLPGANGVVHLVYAGLNGDVYYRRSDDHGVTWRSAVGVARTEDTDTAADHPRLLLDGENRLHVSWTQLVKPKAWPPAGTFASRSLDGGQTWAAPSRVAGTNYATLNMALVGTNTIHRVWNATATTGERRHQWSTDGGATWSLPQVVTPTLRGGLTGFPALAVDSSGVLHLATAVNLGRVDAVGGVFHTAWDGRNWSPPTYVSRGTVSTISVEQPWLTISGGNRLHLVWEEDFGRIQYASRLVDAPSIPLKALPTPVPTAVPIRAQIEAAANPTPEAPGVGLTPTPSATRASAGETGRVGVSTGGPLPGLLVAVIPCALLLGALVVWRVRRQGDFW